MGDEKQGKERNGGKGRNGRIYCAAAELEGRNDERNVALTQRE